MDRLVKCGKCGIVFKAGKRGALPTFCLLCKPSAYRERYKGRYPVLRKYVRKSNQIPPCSPAIKRQVLERDNYTCQICGSKDNLHIHHRDGKSYVKVHRDANNNPENLITLCATCHSRYHRGSTDKIRNLINYYRKYPNISYAALGRIFKLSRERVRQLLS